MSIELKLDSKKVERLETFLNSKTYTDIDSNDITQSPYWINQNSKIMFDINQNGNITIDGSAGFYIPGNKWKKFLNTIISDPFRSFTIIKNRLQPIFQVPRYLPYSRAIDAVMNQKPISDPELSPYRVNHLSLKKIPKVLPDYRAICSHYKSWSKRTANWNVICHYYYSNLLRGYISNNDVKTVLEIGPGNGNFPSIIFNDWLPDQIILIDLPKMIPITFSYLSSLFPSARIILPNEVDRAGGVPNDFDFILITPKQIEIVHNDSIDLAINISSFQEMIIEQIDVYFEFVQKVVRKSGYFFSVNRIEKIPAGDDPHNNEQTSPPNRFFEYPWNDKNNILINEVSRLHRLVQADGSGIRLEQIN